VSYLIDYKRARSLKATPQQLELKLEVLGKSNIPISKHCVPAEIDDTLREALKFQWVGGTKEEFVKGL
jgi:hypothetical protein